jgi:hypothetical protein
MPAYTAGHGRAEDRRRKEGPDRPAAISTGC